MSTTLASIFSAPLRNSVRRTIERHQSVDRGAEWLHSKDSPVAVRLISDVQEDPPLRRKRFSDQRRPPDQRQLSGDFHEGRWFVERGKTKHRSEISSRPDRRD